MNKGQYLRREIIQIFPFLFELSNTELEGLVCKALSLTGNDINSYDLKACHLVKKKENVIMKFRNTKLKYEIINRRKTAENEFKELSK